MIMSALNLNSSQLKRNISPVNVTFVEAVAADTVDNKSCRMHHWLFFSVHII